MTQNIDKLERTGPGPYDKHTEIGKCPCGGDTEVVDWCKLYDKDCDGDCDYMPRYCSHLQEKEVCGICGRIII